MLKEGDWNFEEAAVLARDIFFKRCETRIIKVLKGKRKWMTMWKRSLGIMLTSLLNVTRYGVLSVFSTVQGAFDTSGSRRIDI